VGFSKGYEMIPSKLCHANSQVMRFFRFIRFFFIHRSISSAMWIDEYEQYKPDYTYTK